MIKPDKQSLFSNPALFLNPLNWRVITDIICKSGIDKYKPNITVKKHLRIYFLSMLFDKPFRSLNGIEKLSKNLFCKIFVNLNRWPKQTLSDANKRIDYTIFKDIYEQLSKIFQCSFSKNTVDSKFGDLKIFDTTHLMLWLKLMPWGTAQNQRETKGQMKVGMRINENLFVPDKIVFDNKFRNDNTYFNDLIDWDKKGITYLFDRGFTNTKIFLDIHNSGNFLVTRLHGGISYTVKKNLSFEKEKNGNLEIINDQVVSLGKGKNKTPSVFRLITAISYDDDEPKTLYFLTNRFDLTPFEIARIYRKRWQIELFFRWLKNGLGINHFFSYSENGINIQIYMTLIFNLLLMLFHQQSKELENFGVNTQRAFFNEMFNGIIKWAINIGALLTLRFRNHLTIKGV